MGISFAAGGVIAWMCLCKLLTGRWLAFLKAWSVLLVCLVVLPRSSSAQWFIDPSTSNTYVSVTLPPNTSGGNGIPIGGGAFYDYATYTNGGGGSTYWDNFHEQVSFEGDADWMSPLIDYGDYWAGSAPAYFTRSTKTTAGGLYNYSIKYRGSVTLEIRHSSDPRFTYVGTMKFNGPFGGTKEVLGRYVEIISPHNGMKTAVAMAAREHWDDIDNYGEFLNDPASNGIPTGNAGGTAYYSPNVVDRWYTSTQTNQVLYPGGKLWARFTGCTIIDPPQRLGSATPSTQPAPTTGPTTGPSTMPTTFPVDSRGFWDLLTFKTDVVDDTTYENRSGLFASGLFGGSDLSFMQGRSALEKETDLNINALINSRMPGLSDIPKEMNFSLCLPTEGVSVGQLKTLITNAMVAFNVDASGGAGSGANASLPEWILNPKYALFEALDGVDENPAIEEIMDRCREYLRPVFTVLLCIAFLAWTISRIMWAAGMQDHHLAGDMLLGRDTD